jgi:hypothetical protein
MKGLATTSRASTIFNGSDGKRRGDGPPERVRSRNRKFADSPLEEAVSSEPVSESQNSLLAGKIQGILFFRASEAHHLPEMQKQSQGVMAEFPTDRNRELFRS